jgi:hypothetical protein
VSLLRGSPGVEQIRGPAWWLRLAVRAKTERCEWRSRLRPCNRIRQLNHDVPVAQNLSGHSMHRRLSIPDSEFRDHRRVLLLPSPARIRLAAPAAPA